MFLAGEWEQVGHDGGQLSGLYGLEQPAVDPHAAERLFVAGVQRGGQHEDRGLRRDAEFPGTDLPRDVEPGHVREAHVQQYGVGLQFADEVQGVLSAARHVRGISGLRQRFAEEQGRNRRIFSDHQPSARPRFCGAVRLGEGGGRSGARGGGRFRQAVRVGRQTEQGCEGEHAAHAGRAGERQVAAEAPRDVAGDGKPEAHAGFVLIARIPDAGALFEALEDAFLFVRGDAPAGVDDLEGQRASALGGLRFRPGDAQGHGTLFREFHRVAEQVAERLTQPETVAYEPVGDGVVRHERKPDVPAGAGRAQHGDAGRTARSRWAACRPQAVNSA